MGLFDYLRYTAQANQQPDLGTLNWGAATPAAMPQPGPTGDLSSFSPNTLEQYIASNLDYGNLGGGMWSDPSYGPQGVVSDMAAKLRAAGINDPGALKGMDFATQARIAGEAPGLLSMMSLGNPLGSLFGSGFAGEGGTQYRLRKDPATGEYKFATTGIDTSDKEAIMGALASVGLVMGAGALGGAFGGAGAAGAAEGAAAAGAAEGAAAGGAAGAGSGTAAMGAGAADLGMAGFGQFGIPSAIPAGAGYGSLGATALSTPVSTFGGAAIGGGLAGTLAGMGAAGGASGAGGAAGVTDLGGGLSMGADGAITGATGLNPSTLSNAGLMESFGAGGGGVGGLGGAGGSGGGTPGTFNAAMDSQAANAAIEAAGGDALSGYTAAGIPSVTVNGAAGTSLFDSLAGRVGSMGVSDWLGAGSTLLGALGGAQGQGGSSTSSRAMDPRMDALFYGDLAPRTQGLLGSQMPQAQQAGNQMLSKGSGLLGQTAPDTATNPYATGILNDLQRRQQEIISRGLQQTKGNFVGYGGLGGTRQGVAEADAITRGADNFTGQAANFMGGLYNADQNRLRQDWTLGAGLMGQGVDMPFQPGKNTAQIYSPFTGFGTTTNDAKTGGGWSGALGGALGAAQFAKNMGWLGGSGSTGTSGGWW